MLGIESAVQPFPTTQWTVIAKLSEPGERDSVLAFVCAAYRPPVYSFLRKRGYGKEDADDLTQGFFEIVVRDELLERAERGTGKFRSFVLAVLEKFVANAERTRTALKRGGGKAGVELHEATIEDEVERLISSCATPEEAFDRAWLTMILQRVIEELRVQYEEAGKAVLFTSLLPWLLLDDERSQTDAAAQANISVVNFRVQLHRLRMRYRDGLQREIAATLTSEEDLAEELDYFFKISQRSL